METKGLQDELWQVEKAMMETLKKLRLLGRKVAAARRQEIAQAQRVRASILRQRDQERKG